MGRSVSYASGSTVICYRDVSEEDHDTFDSFLDDIRFTCQAEWPSFYETDKWLGREDHAILENRFCYVGVSEYCGLASIWIVPKDDSNLANNWVELIAPKFKKFFGEFVRTATFSNGESMFERVEA